MDLLTFIDDSERKRQLAVLTGRSAGYLWQIATGWRGKRASPELAIAIERQSGLIGPECVPKESLRPDIWTPAPAAIPRRLIEAPSAPKGAR